MLSSPVSHRALLAVITLAAVVGLSTNCGSDSDAGCNDNGVVHASGTMWKCSCNTCSCENGMTSTTLIGCDEVAAAGDGNADASEDTGADALTDGGTCIELPALDAGDLSCNSDQDCATVWTGAVCSCGCNCPTAAGNVAAYTRMGAALGTLLQHSITCSAPPCECPAFGVPRCFAHQCALCGNMGVVLKNQPAACGEDAAVDGGGD